MIGKYFKKSHSLNSGFDAYYVSSVVDNNAYEVWNFPSYMYNGPALNLKIEIPIDNWNSMIETKEIVEIDPPTMFIVTNRNTFKLKDDIKKAGGRWLSEEKKWYFFDKPNGFKTKEVLLFPFTGRKFR